MTRPRLAIVFLLCACAFLGALAVARASDDSETSAATAPKSLATGASTGGEVAGIGRAAKLPGMKRTRRASGPAAQASAPASNPAPAPAPSSAPAPSPAPAPAPTPKPAPKPQGNQGTPFLDVH